MSWKEKLFTLINTRFYTKEEIDSKATVVFIGYSNFELNYNAKIFSSDDIRVNLDSQIGDYSVSNFLVMELPFGKYSFEAASENSADMYQDETHHELLEVNQKLMFVDAYKHISEPQVTTQQEI